MNVCSGKIWQVPGGSLGILRRTLRASRVSWGYLGGLPRRPWTSLGGLCLVPGGVPVFLPMERHEFDSLLPIRPDRQGSGRILGDLGWPCFLWEVSGG